MQLILFVLAACLAIAVLQYALAVLLVLLLIVIIWGMITQPAETFGLLAFGLLVTLLTNYTAATLVVLALLGLAVVLHKSAAATGRIDDEPHRITSGDECQRGDST